MDAELKSYLDAMEHRAEQREQGLREHIDQTQQALREHIDQREQALREHIDERTHDAETRIVRAFGAYQQSNGTRMRKIEADVSNVDASTTQQMDAFQSKLLELETRIISLEKP
jgi:hypothetical protein